VLGNGRVIGIQTLSEFLQDDVIEIDPVATWVEYEQPKSAEKNLALNRAHK